MNNPIAVIHATVSTESAMNGDQELERLYKVGVVPEDQLNVVSENETGEDVAALFEYNGGYRFLELLGTRDADEAIEEARDRIPDYVLNEELTGVTVTRR